MKMSYPDPPPPPHQYKSQPFPGGFYPPYLTENEQPDLMARLNPPPYKRPRNSENPPTNPRVNPPHAPGSKGTSHIFYKTRICAKFTEGTCRNGETCSFAHGAEDLREPPPNWQDYVRKKEKFGGNSSNSTGDDQRIIRKMKICKKFYNGEPCPYGEKCNFLHELRFPPKERSTGDMHVKRESSFVNVGNAKFEGHVIGRRERTVISIVTTGHHAMCGSGDFDTNQSNTVLWKTRACSKWEIGQCPYGDRCHYAHGTSDLKVPDARVDAEPELNSVPVPVNPLPSYVHTMAPANLTTVANDGGEKKKLKWKPGKKINRIYGDWLDDGSPPRCSSPHKDDM